MRITRIRQIKSLLSKLNAYVDLVVHAKRADSGGVRGPYLHIERITDKISAVANNAPTDKYFANRFP